MNLILWEIAMKVPGNLDTEIIWKKMWSRAQYRNIIDCKQVPGELCEKLEGKS